MALRNYVLPVFLAAAAGASTGGYLYHIGATPEDLQETYRSLSRSDAKALSETHALELGLITFAVTLGLGIRNAREKEHQQAQPPPLPTIPTLKI